jgi:hypothetical protein
LQRWYAEVRLDACHHLAEVEDSRRQLLVGHHAYGRGGRAHGHLQRGLVTTVVPGGIAAERGGTVVEGSGIDMAKSDTRLLCGLLG